jgi:hypothetical protein
MFSHFKRAKGPWEKMFELEIMLLERADKN